MSKNMVLGNSSKNIIWQSGGIGNVWIKLDNTDCLISWNYFCQNCHCNNPFKDLIPLLIVDNLSKDKASYKKKRGRKPIAEEKKQKILELHNAGMSIRTIAKEVKLSKSSVNNIVKKNRTPSSIQSKGGRENISEMDITCPNFKYEKNGHIPEIVRKDENGNTKDGG